MRSARIAGLVVALSLAVTGIGSSQTADTPVQLKDVSIDRASDGASVTVKTSGPAQYEAKLIDTPTRLVIDVSGATYNSAKSRWTSGVEPVKEVRGSQWRKGIARIVVEMTRNDVAYHIDETADGLVVAVESKTETSKLNNGTPDTAKTATKPTPVAVAKVVEKTPAVGPISADTVTDAPKVVKSTVIAAAKPVDKVAAAPAPVSKEPASPATVATAIPAPVPVVVTPAPPAPARMVAQATSTPTTPPAPPASAPTSGEKLISLDFKDADVVNLLRILAAESGRNIVSGDDVKGRVSISLKNVTWEQALDTILEVRGLAKVEKDGVIRIVSLDQLTKEKEAQARVEAARRNAEIETRTKLAEAQLKETELASKKLAADAAAAERRHAVRSAKRSSGSRMPTPWTSPRPSRASSASRRRVPSRWRRPSSRASRPSRASSPSLGGPPNPALGRLPQPNAPYPPPYGPATQPVISVSQDVLAKGITVRANKATNSIFIRHYEADLERIKKLIREQLDVPLPQIKIEARMEILDRNSLEAIGVQWGGAAAKNVGTNTLIGQGFQSTRCDADRHRHQQFHPRELEPLAGLVAARWRPAPVSRPAATS